MTEPSDPPDDESEDTTGLARSIIHGDDRTQGLAGGPPEEEYPNPMGGFLNVLFPGRRRSGGIGPALVFLGCIAFAIVWAVVTRL